MPEFGACSPSFQPTERAFSCEGARLSKWYVAQVRGGRETTTRNLCLERVPEKAMKECFLPEREVMWKVDGEWKLVKKLLFPGYLFFVTDDAEGLYESLQRVPALVRLLGSDERAFFPLTDKETDWFLSFMDREHVVRMSEGYIDGDKVVVTRGPLMGFEGQIRRVDRHKRRAYLDVTMFGRTVPTSIGLEIVRKVA